MKDKTLKLTALICCVVIFLFEFHFSDAPEVFRGGAKLADLSVGLCISYLAAYVFYLVTILYPLSKRKKHLSEYLAALIIDVRDQLDLVVCGFLNRRSYNYENFNVDASRKEISSILSKVYLHTESTKSKNVFGVEKQSVGDYVTVNLIAFEHSIRELANNADYLESEVVKIISELIKNPIKKEVLYLNDCKPEKIGKGVYQNAQSLRDLSSLTDDLVQYISVIRQLDTLLKDNYSSTRLVKEKYENKWKKMFGK
ncbi:hypothetical protein [Pseudoalteromonas sp. T1lg24]|uniref:hypothetical protein n=1 Tax=Pseudoalteromonas sp. T1lg24 TaxID=2077099 RepID=UPI000CF5DB08|nr:hypothetical protein [Pseudoalteromonas sp. T1lg24]